MSDSPIPDPNYGNDICRRAVRLTNVDGATIGELEDSVHAIRCRVEYAQGLITAIDAEFVRHPMTLCGGVLAKLDELVGLPLVTPLTHFYADGKARMHCTHAYDLVWWTIAHAGRAEVVRRYDSIVPDYPDGRVQVSLRINGEAALDWDVADHVIRGPAPFAGQNPRKGFVGWAIANLNGDALEAALVLHKGYFISQSHQFLQVPGRLGEIARRFEGSCWTYQSHRLEQAEQLPSRRNFPDGNGLLAFDQSPEMAADPQNY